MDSGSDLGRALRALRDVVDAARYPLDHGDAGAARRAALELRDQLDDYLMPRVARLDAPVLTVVGGSTGAGKSTLVNSLVRAPVSRSGVLRPTTRGPVLVCHPADGAWFAGGPLLARLRAPGAGSVGLPVVSAPLLRPGLALVDAPDIDSVVARNRELAHDVLAAADLWLFVTTAARYADEVPWRVLRGARDRGAVVAVVLDRVPPPVADEVAADLSRLLSEQGLPAAPLFVINESTLDGHGLLPVSEVASIEAYLTEVATSETRRRAVTRRTLLGAVAAAAATTDELARAAVEQSAAADALAATVRHAFQQAAATAAEQIGHGAVLRGGVYARWRESVASGELHRALRAAQDPARARPAPAPPGRALLATIATSLAALLVEAETVAADEIAHRWYADPAGRPLLDPAAGVVDGGPSGAVAARDLVRDWYGWLRDAATLRAGAAPRPRAHAAGRAPTTRARGTATAATVLLATVVAVAPSTEQITVGARTSAATALHRVVAEPAVTGLGDQARTELLARVADHFATRARDWLDRVEALRIDRDLAPRLRQAAADVSVARQLSLVLGAAA